MHDISVILFFFQQGGSLFIYNYDKLGRLVDVVLPTGEVFELSSHISMEDDGFEVNVLTPLHNPISMISLDGRRDHITIKMEGNDYKKLIVKNSKSKFYFLILSIYYLIIGIIIVYMVMCSYFY